MHWTRLEWTIFAQLNRPRSPTPRERTLLLVAIRLILLGAPLPVLGVVIASVGEHVGWVVLRVAGNVLYVAGLTLMALAMAVGAGLTIIYGD